MYEVYEGAQKTNKYFVFITEIAVVGRDISVSITTDYGLEGPGIVLLFGSCITYVNLFVSRDV